MLVYLMVMERSKERRLFMQYHRFIRTFRIKSMKCYLQRLQLIFLKWQEIVNWRVFRFPLFPKRLGCQWRIVPISCCLRAQDGVGKQILVSSDRSDFVIRKRKRPRFSIASSVFYSRMTKERSKTWTTVNSRWEKAVKARKKDRMLKAQQLKKTLSKGTKLTQ